MYLKAIQYYVLAVLLAGGTVCGQEDLLDGNRLDPCQAMQDQSLFKPLRDIKVRMPRDDMRLPPDCSGPHFEAEPDARRRRFGAAMTFYWEPTNYFHMPAYFDNVPLERYGQTKRAFFEPFVSGAKFAAGIPTLPYKVGVNRPHDCVTTLGHQPPGSCVPCIKQTLPVEADAAFVEAAVAVGLVFLLP